MIAIYPRKSKASDNSQSMEQQVTDCEAYCKQHFPKEPITVYGGDYALTGHSTAKRKDFKRMMNDVKAGLIDIVVVYRYDRIARNMRDFCNLYHDMESNNCSLVSVSQQIDTSTPYGKNFMYQMAAMAELEWSLTSERYKDMIRYKIEQGCAPYGNPPIGFMIKVCEDGKKRFVHDPEYEEMIYAAYQHYRETRSQRDTVIWIRENYYDKFSTTQMRRLFQRDIYVGRMRDNKDFCEPYISEEERNQLRDNNIKTTPSGRIYIFKGLVKCPYDDYHLHGYGRTTQRPGSKKRGPMYIYYNCHRKYEYKEHPTVNISQNNLERQCIDYINNLISSPQNRIDYQQKKKQINNKAHIKELQDELERLNYLFEKCRISIEHYEMRYAELTDAIKSAEDVVEGEEVSAPDLPEGWLDQYKLLDDKHKQMFWFNLVKEIIISKDKVVTDILFK